MRHLATLPILGLAILAAGCATTARQGPSTAGPPPKLPTAGLERVVGKTAADLQALFGTPDQDMREGDSRRLQFVSTICVLDAYLYAPAPGRQPVVTWIDARLPNGDDIDRASCVAALTRR